MNNYFPNEFLNIFDGIIRELMEMFNVPGVSVSVAKDTEIILCKSYGYRDKDTKTPMTNETLVGIGSATKTFTALAIMLLVEEGKIKLDDPVSKYIQFKLGDNSEKISIHHLLSHSSGLPALLGSYIAITMALGTEFTNVQITNWEEWERHINNATNEVCFPPGKKWIYFNDGYTILQRIIEDVSNIKYEEFIQQRILDPLEMERSTFSRERFLKDSDIMTGYLEDTPKSHPFSELIHGSGGLISNTFEVLHFLQLLIYNGKYKDKEIISSDLIKKMTTIHINTPSIQSMTDEPIKEGYGYGLFLIENFCGSKLVFHSGNTSVSSSNMLCIPEKKITISAVSNSGTGEPVVYLIPFILSAVILGRNPEEVLFPKRIEMTLASFIGKYETYKGMLKAQIVRKDGMLYFEPDEVSQKVLPKSRPLIPYDEKLRDLRFYTFDGPVSKTDIEFFINNETSEISMLIGRYLFHKK